MPLYAPGMLRPILLTLAGLGLLTVSFGVDPTWVNRHVVQLHAWPPLDFATVQRIQSTIVWALWIGAVPLFAVAAVIRWGSGQMKFASVLRIALAIVCAFASMEIYLRWRARVHPRPKMTQEVFGTSHPRYGWVWTPSLAATELVASRSVRLAFNRESIRVRNPADELDPKAPSILFTGESISAGQGLQYEETFAALVSGELGVQPVNLAVNGYGCDQAYLRLIDALPRFDRLFATVTTFVPVQLGRNLQDLKPRLVLTEGGTLQAVPAATGFLSQLRLRRLLFNELPYSTDRGIAATIALTRAILRDTVKRTEARGGKAVFLIPLQGPPRRLEEHGEAWLIRSVFEAEGVRYVLIDLEGDLLLPGDPHPSPRGAKLIASALLDALAHRAAAR